MTAADTPRTMPEEDALTSIRARLDAARALHPTLNGATVGTVLRHVPGRRAIAAGHLGDAAVIYRLDLTGEADRTQAEWDEMQRLWPHMSQGRFRIARPILASPEHGLLVIEHVAGTPLLQLLWQTPPEARAPLILPAADWYRQSTAPTEAWRGVGVNGWLKRAARAAEKQPFEALRACETDILHEMRRIAALMEGLKWRVAICHGDLHPNNLIVDGPRMTAIDIGGSSRMPIYKDMARFLVHMGRRRMIPSGEECLGVDRAGLMAFARAFDLNAAERGLFLPFMIGFEALIRVETPALPTSRIRRAERMYRAMLPDLRRVGLDGSPA